MNVCFILDSSVLIELENLNLLDVLLKYAYINGVSLIIPNKVYRETLINLNNIQNQNLLNCIEIISSNSEIYDELSRTHLQPAEGEIEVISLSLELKDKKCNKIIALIDEKKARNIAKSTYNIEVHGTIWLIMELKRKKLINKNQALNIINRFPEHGFYITNNLLNRAINIINLNCKPLS